MDVVVSREAGSSPCVTLGGPTPVLIIDELGPPAMLHPQSFDRPEIQEAAARVQVDWRNARRSEIQVLGEGTAEDCPIRVNRPTTSGDFAFVSYSGPGAEMGAYAFRRVNGQWFVAEKVVLGFW